MTVDQRALKAAGKKAHELVKQHGPEGPLNPEGRAQAIADVLAEYDRTNAEEKE